MIPITFRPLPVWPHPETRSRRHRPFSASFQATLDLIDRELRHVGAVGIHVENTASAEAVSS